MKHFNEQAWLRFRKEHPEMRFWQALCAFTDKYIYITDEPSEMAETFLIDTFYVNDEK